MAMKNKLKKLARKFVARLLSGPIDRYEVTLQALAESNFRTRALVKLAEGQPIHVVFACHLPALWSTFESVYKAVVEDPNFTATVIALPVRSGTPREGQYQDGGIYDYLKGKGINVIQGYDRIKNQWTSPASLAPDYLFFQTPYHLFPRLWSIETVSLIARVCYLPYASALATGEVEKTAHPKEFFKYVSLAFMECPLQKQLFDGQFSEDNWYRKERTLVSGYPKFDYLTEAHEFHGSAWKRGMSKDIKRILWTPRWRTSEGTCHFFDYKNYFVQLCGTQNIDFVFRPHPLCLPNFIKTGEMSPEQQKQMQSDYERSSNMSIDLSGSYEDTFMTSDLLISDFSSMMIEYFATGKPIVYTHRKNIFNEFGRRLAEGVYWVRNIKELNETVRMLVSGKDPLRQKRHEIMKELIYLPEGGAARNIKEIIATDYR